MLTRIKTATLVGVEGTPVVVETDIHRGLPALTVVGLADTTIKEALSRIKPAILNSGYKFPDERITVNLVPAGKPKEGSHFDLPIAVGVLTLGWSDLELSDTAFLGELSLDGRLNPVKGALPLAMSLRQAGIRKVILPFSNAAEVSILKDMDIFPAKDLKAVAAHITGSEHIPLYNGRNYCCDAKWQVDFSQVVGQETAKRAVVTGVAGNHGILLMGGPGCGKTMIAKRIPTIMPELTYEEKLEITGIYSVAGLLSEETPLVEQRPFRMPHHTISQVGLLGGGKRPKPGELSLAHGGVLFLDEFGEFETKTIDAMRQPVEEGVIRINRDTREVIFPARVMVVAAANPCKCGYLWDENKICTCSRRQIQAYGRKLTGPFSDRIDMHIRMYPVPREVLDAKNDEVTRETSENFRKQVAAALDIQRRRYRNLSYTCNGQLDEWGIKNFCILDDDCKKLMNTAYEKLGFTMRAYNKLLKVARTIADLEGEEQIKHKHIAEALMYRVSDGETNQI